MIFDTLENLKNYKGISVNFDRAIESIMAGDYLNSFIDYVKTENTKHP